MIATAKLVLKVSCEHRSVDLESVLRRDHKGVAKERSAELECINAKRRDYEGVVISTLQTSHLTNLSLRSQRFPARVVLPREASTVPSVTKAA